MNTICEAQDSPGNKVTVPTSSNSPPTRAALGRIATGLARSGSPQLESNNPSAKHNAQ